MHVPLLNLVIVDSCNNRRSRLRVLDYITENLSGDFAKRKNNNHFYL